MHAYPHWSRREENRRSLTRAAALLALLAAWQLSALADDAPGESKAPAQKLPATHRWFAMPIEVQGMAPGAQFVPVSRSIDFSEILENLDVPGVVEERTLRLCRILPDGSEVEQPVQFLATPQPRLKNRQLLPGTTDRVSYLAEHAPGKTPEVPRVKGELAWIARADAEGNGRYRLVFGVPTEGRMIQVPYPPQNLRGFDAQGRATPLRYFPHMQIRPQWPLDGVVHITDNGRPVTSFHTGPTRDELNEALRTVPPVAKQSRDKLLSAVPIPLRRPFFYPVNGPDGVSLTEFGKAHDPTGSHRHHYSLWIAHADVGGRTFWSDSGGLIAHERFDLMEDGPVFCRLVQRTRWTDLINDLLSERRTWTIYAGADDFRLIDVQLELTQPRGEPITLGKTTFGFLAVRVAQSMTVFDGGGEILNARGNRNEQNAHLKRAEWIDLSGPVTEKHWGGIAILDHPENPNHPTGWHCRNDGWAGASFNMHEPYTLQPDKPLTLRYRLVLHRHNATKANISGHYAAYRTAPTITLAQPRPYSQ